MTNENLLLKREILLKEEERHQLTFIGATKNLSKAIEQTLFRYKGSVFNKTYFLDCFYNEIIKYQDFIDKQKKSNMKLKRHLSHISKSYLKSKKEKNHAPLDQELKYNKISIGWFFPSEIFEDYYCRFCSCKETFDNPTSVNAFFQKHIDRQYPLEIDQYIDYLKKNISSFWEATCSYIKEIINIAARHALFAPQQTEQIELIKDSAWSDTYEVLQSKLQECNNTLSFKNGTDFRNYIIQICNYRLQNQRTKYAVKEEPLDQFPYLEQEVQDEKEEEKPFHSLVDVDIHNAYEVAYAIAIILLNPKHPFYHSLTYGIEDKVDVLLRKVIKGQCYNKIVEEKYNMNPDSSDFSKIVVKTRKEYERTRKTLQERFIKIKKEQE
ncbi:hypothetical protein [uncultured Parabacteroides sp.]|uniref:hypothetical protein n=1 Tax=uncultured Parabacteroides sp. TaxID=512312 RepID=UPI0025DD2448|nr:hypothetical protein [uncultured Parabacteroides sp.]